MSKVWVTALVNVCQYVTIASLLVSEAEAAASRVNIMSTLCIARWTKCSMCVWYAMYCMTL